MTTTVDPLAQAVMIARCGWDPTEVVTDRSVRLRGTRSNLVLLPSMYVTAVTAVSITDRYSRATTTLDVDTDIDWEENGELYLARYFTWWGTSWPAGHRNITVTYSGGYNPVPADLAAALASLSKRTPAGGNAVEKRLGTAMIRYAADVAAGGLLVTEQMVFDRYRLPKVR